MHKLYNQNMYNFGDPQPSYWESTQGLCKPNGKPLVSNETYDVAIIGGGYTGLSAAYHLGRKFGIEVGVLEAGHIGWGASGRNGGFCSIGGAAGSVKDLVKRFGLSDVKAFYKSQVDAIELVKEIITDNNIDASIQGESELYVAHSKKAFNELNELKNFYSQSLGLDARNISSEEFRGLHFDSTEQYGALELKPTFGLHPMRYINGLAVAAEHYGAKLYPYSEVQSWEKKGDYHTLHVSSGSIRAKHVIFATNGFMPETLHKNFTSRSLPVISSIIVTRPLSNLELDAYQWKTLSPAINSRKLMNYFRLLPDKRFLFGGRGSSSGDKKGETRNYEYLAARMKSIWPEWKDIEIDYCWHGFVCFTRRLTPAIGRLSDDKSIFFGFGYHGNGVNTSTWVGKQLAIWLASNNMPASISRLSQGLSPKFPFAPFRRHYLQAIMTWYRVQDSLRYIDLR